MRRSAATSSRFAETVAVRVAQACLPMLAFVAGLGCNTILGFESEYHTEAGVGAGGDSGSDVLDSDVDASDTSADGAGGSAGQDGEASCDPCQDPSLERLPCRPQGEDISSGAPVLFAARTMRLGFAWDSPDDWLALGLDRDCLNTNAVGEPSSCVLRVAENGADGLAGRDNGFGKTMGAVGRFLKTWGYLDTDLEVAVNQDMEKGFSGWTLTLDDFNQTADDPQVTLVLRLSEGTTDAAGAEWIPAEWDGSDLWSIDPESLSAIGDPLYLDDNAFVVDNVLVAKMPQGVPFRVQTEKGGLTVNMNEVVIKARMSDDHMRIVEGAVSGLWPLSVAVNQIASYAETFGLCAPNPLVPLLQKSVEEATDIRGDLVPAPALECNAVSFGMAFTAEAALLGPTAPVVPDVPGPCADAGADGG